MNILTVVGLTKMPAALFRIFKSITLLAHRKRTELVYLSRHFAEKVQIFFLDSIRISESIKAFPTDIHRTEPLGDPVELSTSHVSHF